MRSRLKTFILASAAFLAFPALAHASENIKPFEKLQTSAVKQDFSAVKIDIVYSEDMKQRANSLPSLISLRGPGTIRGTRSGFSGNGYYGDRSLDNLAKSLDRKMTKRFKKKGISVSEDAPVTLRVTIVDARNNRPTFKQVSQEPGLSFQSIRIGGVELTADLVDQSGNTIDTMHYSYFERDFEISDQFSSVWYDANQGFNFFAKEAAKQLSN